MVFGSAVRGAAVLAVVLAGFAVSCDAEPAAPPAVSAPAYGGALGPSDPSPSAPSPTGAPTLPGSRPELVRDAFAGLQATLDDSCTPGNCAYTLGRLDAELHDMDRAMKADPKGPGHFPEPIALIAKLDKELGGDRSTANLEKHKALLIGTRDKINTWMQGHPDDYR
ncbi:hypothetical protein ADK75_16650 [Streptomyces virginiae]|uniref:Lipoprotein n=1 Tax=Streptomyces virginiae TaxID=1961 RepID=A0A0L8MMR7_STRVG|nr:hypothetical protein [Streptomyces virginiae]KOG51620.1 hypothetical protein ADK75_16650 [Streptomyces virginiae]